jgi:glycosyltransferase involved in cell wall biosynthesis
MKPSFSCVLIARNEEKTLPRMLASLTEFKNRGGVTVVVDTGSTDKTAQVARDWGCIVEEVGDRFRITISEEQAKEINERFVVNDEAPVVKAGDSLFDFASARNYAATLSPTDWVWMPDCDEVFTKFDLDEIQKVMEDPTIDRLSYDFVFSHDSFGEPAISFLHSKCYRRSKMKWFRIIHEILQDIPDELQTTLGADEEKDAGSMDTKMEAGG